MSIWLIIYTSKLTSNTELMLGRIAAYPKFSIVRTTGLEKPKFKNLFLGF